MDSINGVHVSRPGLVVVDVAAADDATALALFLEGAGVAEPDAILDDPQWAEWRGGPAHEFSDA